MPALRDLRLPDVHPGRTAPLRLTNRFFPWTPAVPPRQSTSIQLTPHPLRHAGSGRPNALRQTVPVQRPHLSAAVPTTRTSPSLSTFMRRTSPRVPDPAPTATTRASTSSALRRQTVPTRNASMRSDEPCLLQTNPGPTPYSDPSQAPTTLRNSPQGLNDEPLPPQPPSDEPALTQLDSHRAS